MNNKDIKKQHSAQALENDRLENVSGGFHDPGAGFLLLSKEEQQCLNEDQSWKLSQKEKMNLKISISELIKEEARRKKAVLEKHGFTETPLF